MRYPLLTLFFALAVALPGQDTYMLEKGDSIDVINYPYKLEVMDIGETSSFFSLYEVAVKLARYTHGPDQEETRRVRLVIKGYVSHLTADHVDVLIADLTRFSSMIGEKPTYYVEHRNQIPSRLDYGIVWSKNKWLFYFDTDEFLDRGFTAIPADAAGQLVKLLKQSREMLK